MQWLVMKRKRRKNEAPEPLPQLPASGAIIGYARVSTDEQNLDLQLRALEKAGCERIYSETCSAVAPKRPELAKAMELLRDGDMLVVWKLDRLARSMVDLLDKAKYISGCGAKLKSLTEQLDTSTPIGTPMFHLLGALAEFERSLTLARIHEGMKAARARGQKLGANPKFDKVAPEMQAMRNAGSQMREIAAKFKCSVGSVRNWTRHPDDIAAAKRLTKSKR